MSHRLPLALTVLVLAVAWLATLFLPRFRTELWLCVPLAVVLILVYQDAATVLENLRDNIDYYYSPEQLHSSWSQWNSAPPPTPFARFGPGLYSAALAVCIAWWWAGIHVRRSAPGGGTPPGPSSGGNGDRRGGRKEPPVTPKGPKGVDPVTSMAAITGGGCCGGQSGECRCSAEARAGWVVAAAGVDANFVGTNDTGTLFWWAAQFAYQARNAHVG